MVKFWQGLLRMTRPKAVRAQAKHEGRKNDQLNERPVALDSGLQSQASEPQELVRARKVLLTMSQLLYNEKQSAQKVENGYRRLRKLYLKSEKKRAWATWWATFLLALPALGLLSLVTIYSDEELAGIDSKFEIVPANDFSTTKLSDYRPYLFIQNETTNTDEPKSWSLMTEPSTLSLERGQKYTLDLVILAKEGSEGWPVLNFQVPRAVSVKSDEAQNLILTETIKQDESSIGQLTLLSPYDQRIEPAEVEKVVDITGRSQLLAYASVLGWNNQTSEVSIAGCDRLQRYRLTFWTMEPEYVVVWGAKIALGEGILEMIALILGITVLLAFAVKSLVGLDIKENPVLLIFPDGAGSEPEQSEPTFADDFKGLLTTYADAEHKPDVPLDEALWEMLQKYDYLSTDQEDN